MATHFRPLAVQEQIGGMDQTQCCAVPVSGEEKQQQQKERIGTSINKQYRRVRAM